MIWDSLPGRCTVHSRPSCFVTRHSETTEFDMDPRFTVTRKTAISLHTPLRYSLSCFSEFHKGANLTYPKWNWVGEFGQLADFRFRDPLSNLVEFAERASHTHPQRLLSSNSFGRFLDFEICVKLGRLAGFRFRNPLSSCAEPGNRVVRKLSPLFYVLSYIFVNLCDVPVLWVFHGYRD